MLQAYAVDTWLEHEGVGTLVMCTGIGKSRIAVLAAQDRLNSGKIDGVLIVVPTDSLIEGWRVQFKRWAPGLDEKKIIIVCLQSAYKLGSSTHDNPLALEKLNPSTTLLVVDEVHTAMSEQYYKVFSSD
jgi:superfamily II DNA or RNA helicase